jgi:hypothetical protein
LPCWPLFSGNQSAAVTTEEPIASCFL